MGTRPVVESKAAPPADTPIVQGVDEVGCFSTNRIPMFSVPPPPLLSNMSNVPIGATLPHRGEVDTPCSRLCMLVPSQHAGVVPMGTLDILLRRGGGGTLNRIPMFSVP